MKRGPPEEQNGGASSRPEKRLAGSETGRKRSLLNALAKLAGTQVKKFYHDSNQIIFDIGTVAKRLDRNINCHYNLIRPNTDH
jgi:hypothetical protein